jgi:multidrug efflux system outer membrane protein
MLLLFKLALVFLIREAPYANGPGPLASILVVPMCFLCAMTDVGLQSLDNPILTQIGYGVLGGLACKKAILIPTWACATQETGQDYFTAVIEIWRVRLRPLLIASLVCVLSVVPHRVPEGPGAEMRPALNTLVCSGMLSSPLLALWLWSVCVSVVIRCCSQHKTGAPIPELPHAIRLVLLVLVLLELLSGCQPVGPNYREPVMQVPPAFANQDQPGMSTVDVEVRWWRGFQDETLNALVDEALASNYAIRIATARLREARALRLGTQFDRVPTVTAEATYTRERLSQADAGDTDRDTALYHAGFDASWELDFFGRVRRAIEASTADVGAAEASRRDVIVSLLAEVASNYFELRGAQNQLAVARQNAENQRHTLELTRALRAARRGTELDVARAEAQLHATLASIPPLEATSTHAVYRLGVLIGQPPTALSTTLAVPRPLPSLPTLVAVGKPEDLLRRRPDVRLAERTLAAATARVGVVTADLFPRVTVVGSVGLEAGSLVGFGKGGIDTFSLGPRIFWAAFDLGRVRARIRAADARTEAALAEYEQRVLLALEETEKALVDFQRQQARCDLLRASAQASEKAVSLARMRYQFGIVDFLAVLEAERTLLNAQDLLAASETRTATTLIAVYKALGGGWEQRE